jgi:membrane protein YdbS with pleckstrin-like domain
VVSQWTRADPWSESRGRRARSRAESARVRRYLSPGEEVRLESRPHGIALGVPLTRAAVIATAGAVLVVLGGRVVWPLAAVGAGLLGAAGLLALRAVLRWDRTMVVLTTEKLVVEHGVLRRRAAAVRLARVGTVEVEQGLLGRILGYGTIVAGNLEIPYVARPADFCRLVR